MVERIVILAMALAFRHFGVPFEQGALLILITLGLYIFDDVRDLKRSRAA